MVYPHAESEVAPYAKPAKDTAPAASCRRGPMAGVRRGGPARPLIGDSPVHALVRPRAWRSPARAPGCGYRCVRSSDGDHVAVLSPSPHGSATDRPRPTAGRAVPAAAPAALPTPADTGVPGPAAINGRRGQGRG